MRSVGESGPAGPSETPAPEVSIVLPGYNEGQRLLPTLAAIRDTVKGGYQVIVVNDASTDGCCDALRADPPPFENLVLVDLPHRHGVAHARNLGAEQARAPILVAMDAHCIPRHGWLAKLLEELHKPGVGIVAPRISQRGMSPAHRVRPDHPRSGTGRRLARPQADKPYPVPLAGCACMAMTREFFEAAGRFEAMRSYGMEDVEICIRGWLLGYSVIMVPDAEVAHWFKREPFPVGWQDYLVQSITDRCAALRRRASGANPGHAARQAALRRCRQQSTGERRVDAL